jgi:putative ABC transport system substrate-binding protein
MNNRRKLIVALGAGAFAEPFGSFAQQPPVQLRRIGLLGVTSATTYARQVEALRTGLRELGYVEGKNLDIEFRWAEGRLDQLPGLAAELVRLKVDVIVTSGPGTRVAKQATGTIPIVMTAVADDPVSTGLVASFARPGGNITGSTFFGPELAAKRLELIKEALPRIRRVAVLFNSSNPEGSQRTLSAMQDAARALKLELQQFGVSGPAEFESAFLAMIKQRVEAVAVQSDTTLVANAGAVAALAAKHRIPSVGPVELAQAGGLIAYEVNFPALWHRAAYFADKILKGMKPGDIPIERATRFETVVNLKTAKTLGIKIPNSILVQATKVIE